MPRVEDNFSDGAKDENAGAGNFKAVDTKDADTKEQSKAASAMGVDIEHADDAGDDSEDNSDFSESEEEKSAEDKSEIIDSNEESDDESEDDDDEDKEFTFSSLDDEPDEEEELDDKSEDDQSNDKSKEEESKDESAGAEDKSETPVVKDEFEGVKPKDATEALLIEQHRAFTQHFEAHKDFYPPEVLTAYKQFQKVGGDAGRVFIIQNEHLNKLDDALAKISSSLPFSERFETAFKIAFNADQATVRQAEKRARAKAEIDAKKVSNAVSKSAGVKPVNKPSKHSDAAYKMAKRMGVSLD